MAQEKLFDAFEYFKHLGETNKLARDNNFKVGYCSGPDSIQFVMEQFRKTSNFILVDDTTSQNTYSNKVGFFRRDVYTVFIVAGYDYENMEDREQKLSLCRRIFRQMQSRLIHDKEEMVCGDSLEYLNVDNVYSNEFSQYAMNGVTGLYFMIQNEEPIDLQYDESEWTE